MDLDEKIARVPDRPGVYLYRDGKQQVLYVGKAASLRSRVRSYFQESRPRDPKTDALVRQIRDLEYIVTDNELEALMLEANLVRRHRPRYNIILRDDKHYPFLKLTTNEEFPRLVVARKVQHDGARYYGPFYPATAMRETLRLTRQLFPLRTCSITIDGSLERPCIQYAIHRCNAPCTGWETREGYARTVEDVAHFLEGRDEELARRLTKEMEEAAAELKFERATVLRDQIQSLNKVRERQKIISTDDVDQDVVGVVRQGSDACVELFFVRKGRLVGQEPFFFDKVAGWSDGEILSAFVRQFYGKAVTPAPEILLSEELPEAELTTEWLSTLSERRVQVLAPQRGSKRQFVAMAEANAAIALQNRLLSRDNRQQLVLEELQRALDLPGLPNRIEGYDISNIQGTEQVGSMVVWENGGMKKDDYKRFRIRTVAGADDFASMAEGADAALREGPRAEQRASRPRADRRRARPAQRRAQGAAGSRARLHSGGRAREAGRRGLSARATPPAGPRSDVARAAHLAADPGRSAPLRDHVPQEAPHEADDPVRARHDPGHRAVDPHEPAQDARLGASGARILGRGAGVGAESYPQAGPADLRPLSPDGRDGTRAVQRLLQ
jgi:excinuclease ABC subunit C